MLGLASKRTAYNQPVIIFRVFKHLLCDNCSGRVIFIWAQKHCTNSIIVCWNSDARVLRTAICFYNRNIMRCIRRLFTKIAGSASQGLRIIEALSG